MSSRHILPRNDSVQSNIETIRLKLIEHTANELPKQVDSYIDDTVENVDADVIERLSTNDTELFNDFDIYVENIDE